MDYIQVFSLKFATSYSDGKQCCREEQELLKFASESVAKF